MLNSQQRKLLQLLYRSEYITATELAEQLGIGVKTARTRIKELNPVLEKYGTQIHSKARYGYFIEPKDKEDLVLNNETEGDRPIPVTTGERANYLLAYLLNQKDYVKADVLCDFLYISKSTLTNTLRQVEEQYKRYHITLEKKPNYGIKVKGSEFDIRQCMVDIFVKQDGLDGIGRGHQTAEIKSLGEMVYQNVSRYGIRLSEISYNDFVEHIYIALRRMKQKKYVDLQKTDVLGENEWKFLNELVERIEEKYQICFPQAEKEYLALQLAGKCFIGKIGQDETNFVIQSEVDHLVGEMMDVVYQEFQTDFRSNLELRMALNRHLVPLGIRLKYKIHLHNPMLEEIKKNYMLAYTIASQASIILKEYYQSDISEDEIGDLAVIFELALEQQENEGQKFSILIVCASGKSSSRLLEYKYSREFKDYLEQIYVCNLYELEQFDFNKVDYVLTTVPISIRVPVPIVEISTFLQESDIAAVKELFEKDSKDFLRQYYRPELFFTDIKGNSRDEVLKDLCGRIQELKDIPEEFYDSVLRREELSPTDYGNLVAIPHPDKVFNEKTFVAAAILEEPVFWSRQKVQIIILTAIGKTEDSNIQKFYEATTDFILRPEDIEQVIREKRFDTLMRMLRK